MVASVVSASRVSCGDAEQRCFPRGRPRPSTTTIHFVPLPRLVFPTPQPLFSPERNCRPETIRSISIAGARLTRSETFARYATKRPAPQHPKNPFQHTAILDPRPPPFALFGQLGEQGRDFLPLRFGQQRTASRHRPSFGAADSAYPSFHQTQP